MLTQTTPTTKSHHVRTAAAAFFGVIGVLLLVNSVLVVWLNRTLTDPKTFSSTVDPLVTKPAIQTYVSQQITSQILSNTSPEELGAALLPQAQTAGKSDEELTAQAQSYVQQNVHQVVTSAQFKTLWDNTINGVQGQIISQLNANDNQLTVDLSPAINGVVEQLKQSQLAPVAKDIAVKPDAAKLELKGKPIAKLHSLYKSFQAGTVGIVVAAVVMLAISVALSVYHSKTVRRILIVVGVTELVVSALLEAPFVIKVGDGSAQSKAALAIVQALVRNLQLATLVIGVVCIAAAIVSKLYAVRRRRSPTTAKPA